MRREFIGHHPPTSDEIDKIWTSALVVVDTNVLLSLYRLSASARDKLMNILRDSADRLWIPHQVGFEFHENRVNRIREQRGMGKKIEGTLESFKKGLSSTLQEYSQNAFFEPDALQSQWDRVVDDFKRQVREMHSSQMNSYAITPQNDSVLESLAELYEGKIGPKPSPGKLEDLYKVAKIRFEESIPPGYKDAKNKPAPRCYGDYILWWQILEHARNNEADVLFVTDDKKSDWWWESEGEVLGPEPRLRKEFCDETGQAFYSYRSNQFVRIFDERRSVPVDEAVVEEIRVVNDTPEAQPKRRYPISDAIKILSKETSLTERQITRLIKAASRVNNPGEMLKRLHLSDLEANNAAEMRDRSLEILTVLQEQLHEATIEKERADLKGDSSAASAAQERIYGLTERVANAKASLGQATTLLDHLQFEATKLRREIEAMIPMDDDPPQFH
ncbi:PIN domain-containing protein [Lentzea sp. NPDC058450]|uniref:PIN domain-containing protein n=1 Tax=Lentzea sp. NPDC058450 TaxID=3346505 RepID=UPI00364C8571